MRRSFFANLSAPRFASTPNQTSPAEPQRSFVVTDPIGFTPSNITYNSDINASYAALVVLGVQQGGGRGDGDGNTEKLIALSASFDASFNSLDASLNILDASLNILDASLNSLGAETDGKVTALEGGLAETDGKVTALEGGLAETDGKVTALEGGLDGLFSAAPIYAAGAVTSTSTNFTVTWTLPTRNRALNFVEPGLQASNLVPRINSTRVMIRRVDTDPASAFVQTDSSTSPLTFLSRTFNINAVLGGGVTIVAGGVYDVKVYGVNFALDDETQQLVIQNVSLQQAGAPSIVRTPTSFSAPSRTSLRFTFVKPEFNDSQNSVPDNPAISAYRIRFQAVGSSKRAVPFHNASEITFDPAANNATTQIDRSTGIVQATTYRWLGISARNAVNPSFGPELATNINTTTPDPISSDFIAARNPNAATITSQSRTFWRGVLGSPITTNYYNTGTAGEGTEFASAFAFTGTATFFVNGGQLGRITTDPLVTLKSSFRTGTGDFTDDQTITLPGFAADSGTPNSITTTPASPAAVGFAGVAISDPQSANDNLKTMAIVGQAQFAAASIPATFAVSGENTYTIRFEIIGTGSLTDIQVGAGSASVVEQQFVVDDLSDVPTVSISSSTISDPTFIRVCNIPSLQTFGIGAIFECGNLCSETTKFVPSDRKFGRLELSSTHFVSSSSLTEEFNFTSDANNPTASRTITSTPRTVRLKTKKINIAATAPDRLSELASPAALTARAFNLRSAAGVSTASTLTDTDPIWFDMDSFTDSFISAIKPFGTNAFVWNPEFRYEPLPTQVVHTVDILDSQLLFVDNRYSAQSGFYRDYRVYKGVGPNYSSFSATGTPLADSNYKWITFKFTNQTSFVTSTQDTQQKRLLINGLARAGWNANWQVLFMQIQTSAEPVPKVETMWLNSRKSFVDSQLADFTDRTLAEGLDDGSAFGNHNDSNAGHFVFRTSGSAVTFDIYVRVGIKTGSNSAAEITQVALNNFKA